MIALGLDYGTTNSLVVVYQKNMMQKLRQVHIPSLYRCGDTVVRTPKRELNKISRNNFNTIPIYIKDCVEKLFSQLKVNHLAESDLSDVNLVITVPNAFKDPQVAVLKGAVSSLFNVHFPGSRSGVEIIPEPVAAALYVAYSWALTGRTSYTQYLVVSDMGGGTTDTAVVKINASEGSLSFKVVCTEQQIQLGGEDINKGIANYLRTKYPMEVVSENDLLDACEFLKTQLTFYDTTSVVVVDSMGNPYMFKENVLEVSLSKQELENVLKTHMIKTYSFEGRYKAVLEKLKKDFKTILKKEGYGDAEIVSKLKNDTYYLPVGGTSQIPKIREYLKEVFNESILFELSNEVDNKDGNPKYDSVCRGAAIYSAFLSGQITESIKDVVIEGRTLHRISIRYAGQRLFTCVERSLPDGDYPSFFTPIAFNPGGGSFSLNRLEFYQGGDGEHLDDDCELIGCYMLPEEIYTTETNLDNISVKMYTNILNGRLNKVTIKIPNCHLYGEDADYEKVITLDKYEI